MRSSQVVQLEHTVIIQAAPERVLRAFFDPQDLAEWWQVVRSVTVPRPLGAYAVEWNTTEYRDEILGPLGGVFYGTVVEYRPGVEFFVADAYWSPPEGEAIGPMALEVRCAAKGGPGITSLRVRQSARDISPRWQRYFEVVGGGWHRALTELKDYLDYEWLRKAR